MTRDQLIQKMISIYHNDRMPPNNQTFSGMAAALDVVLAEVLGRTSRDEGIEVNNEPYADWFVEAVERLHKYRRALYSKVKTAEERVTVKVGTINNVHIEMDGKCMFSCKRKEDAEIYRLGLIAALKAGQQ